VSAATPTASANWLSLNLVDFATDILMLL